MKKIQFYLAFFQKPNVVFGLIMASFFLKGVFIAILFPILTGQDEARHYNTVQFLAEPAEKTWAITEQKHLPGIETIAGYNFSEEIRQTGLATGFDVVRHESYNTANFTDTYNGENETQINSLAWKPYNDLKPHDLVGTPHFYHQLLANIEKYFSGSNIFVRFFLERILSIIFGTIAILASYLIMKNIGFGQWESLALTGIVAFQPKLSMYTGNINYDTLLIPLFFLFTLGAVLSLKNGLSWKNGSLMIASIIFGLMTKGIAGILMTVFICLIVFHTYKKLGDKTKIKKYSLFALLLIVGIFFVSRAIGYNFIGMLPFSSDLPETFSSFLKYADKSLTPGRLGLTSRTYWGALGWGSDWLVNNVTSLIWLVEAFSLLGLVMYFRSKKKPDFLPEKKYVIFLTLMIIALQLGIRTYDWTIFKGTGSLDLGTPGRYFLPNLSAHIALVFVGLGMLLKKESYFRNSLLAGLIFMFAFSMYLIFNIVLPRFYL